MTRAPTQPTALAQKARVAENQLDEMNDYGLAAELGIGEQVHQQRRALEYAIVAHETQPTKATEQRLAEELSKAEELLDR